MNISLNIYEYISVYEYITGLCFQLGVKHGYVLTQTIHPLDESIDVEILDALAVLFLKHLGVGLLGSTLHHCNVRPDIIFSVLQVEQSQANVFQFRS